MRKLTLKEYQGLTMNTCAALPSVFHDAMHMVLGMGSELKELLEAKDVVQISEEITDVCWYVSNYANFYKINLSEHFDFKNTMYNEIVGATDIEYDIELVKAVADLQDYEKKELAYKRMIISEKRVELLCNILKATNDCYMRRFINPEKSLYNNIAKLAKRYPNSFTEFDALNRDVVAEREILSK